MHAEYGGSSVPVDSTPSRAPATPPVDTEGGDGLLPMVGTPSGWFVDSSGTNSDPWAAGASAAGIASWGYGTPASDIQPGTPWGDIMPEEPQAAYGGLYGAPFGITSGAGAYGGGSVYGGGAGGGHDKVAACGYDEGAVDGGGGGGAGAYGRHDNVAAGGYDEGAFDGGGGGGRGTRIGFDTPAELFDHDYLPSYGV